MDAPSYDEVFGASSEKLGDYLQHLVPTRQSLKDMIMQQEINGKVFFTLRSSEWLQLGLTMGAVSKLEALREELVAARDTLVEARVKRARLDSLCGIRGLHQAIMRTSLHGKLADVEFFGLLPHPTPVSTLKKSESFEYMGRLVAEEVLDFIVNSLVTAPGAPRRPDGPKYAVITGTAGSGKTTCVMACAVYLHQRCARAREQFPVSSIETVMEKRLRELADNQDATRTNASSPNEADGSGKDAGHQTGDEASPNEAAAACPSKPAAAPNQASPSEPEAANEAAAAASPSDLEAATASPSEPAAANEAATTSEAAPANEADGSRRAEDEEDGRNASFCRVAYVGGQTFVQDPVGALKDALLLAYIDDEYDAIAINEAQSYEDLQSFMRRMGARDYIYVIVGDANAIDDDDEEEDKGRMARKGTRAQARSILLKLMSCCFIIICHSVRSSLRSDLLHDKRPAHYFMSGGFQVSEFDAYLRHKKLQLTKSQRLAVFQRTGLVPRLVYKHLHDAEGALSWDLYRYVRCLKKYVAETDSEGIGELYKGLCGDMIFQLSQVLDTRCFYQGNDGRGKCLVPVLRSYALAYLTKRLREKADTVALLEVGKWTGRIVGDCNLARIGWCAEIATILVLELLQPELVLENGCKLVVDPQVVLTGRLNWDVLRQYRGTRLLIIPETFNHRGADVYFIANGYLVIIQISTATNAMEAHASTKDLAETYHEVLARGVSGLNLKTLLAWIVHTERTHTRAGDGSYEEVVLSFGTLHTSLKCIDERCTELKGKPPARADDACIECSEYECHEGSGDFDNWVQCSCCKSWVHQVCAGNRFQGELVPFSCIFCAGDDTVVVTRKNKAVGRIQKIRFKFPK